MITMHSIRCARPSDLIYLPAIEREAAAQFQATPYPAMADADLASARLDLDRDYVWVIADVPWNGPYYARLGFRTLDLATLNPALQAVRRAEESAGLPMAHRICMQLDL